MASEMDLFISMWVAKSCCFFFFFQIFHEHREGLVLFFGAVLSLGLFFHHHDIKSLKWYGPKGQEQLLLHGTNFSKPNYAGVNDMVVEVQTDGHTYVKTFSFSEWLCCLHNLTPFASIMPGTVTGRWIYLVPHCNC